MFSSVSWRDVIPSSAFSESGKQDAMASLRKVGKLTGAEGEEEEYNSTGEDSKDFLVLETIRGDDGEVLNIELSREPRWVETKG